LTFARVTIDAISDDRRTKSLCRLASGSWRFFELPIMERAKEWLARRNTVLSAGQSLFDKDLLAAPSRI